ncbi:TonB-dependent siderophore receptor [Hyphomicrobium sp.]|uniref:TonB-dependent siderophore receptor n=1 Tax=Hyphomicrobium sp. TaxID=82 RepID=UPI002FDDD3E8
MNRKAPAFVALPILFCAAGQAVGQEAAEPAPAAASTALPAVEVTATTPKAKKQAAAKKAPVAAPPQAAAPAPAVDTEQGPPDASRGEASATGPVNGYVAKLTATGTKTGAPILETPQSISVVTADQIEDQGAGTLSEALRYTPGVVVELNGASSRYSEARIRGFTPVQYLDGLAVPNNTFFGTPRFEPYGLERIEALKGPASFLFGQNSPGGLLNMVSKRPLDEPLNEVRFEVGSYERFQTAFDFSGPATADKKFLYRVTGVFRDAETEVDYTRDDLAYIAPAFTWKPTSNTTFTLLGHYGADYGTYPHQYVPAQGSLLPNPNGRISRRTFLGEPGWDKFDRDQWAIGYELDHKFDDVFTFRSHARVSRVDNLFRAHRVEGLQADLETVNRGAYVQATDASSFAADNQLQADFSTGALDHQVLVGVDYFRMSGGYDFTGDLPKGTPDWPGIGIDPINIFNPVYGARVQTLFPFAKNDITQDQIGIYAQDQVKWGGWILTLGGRHDWVETKTEDLLRGTAETQKDDAFTGRAGLSYVFANGIAPYVSYATSFQPIAGIDALGNPFQPSEGRQYEAGIKYQPPGANVLITAAAFDIVEQNVVTIDPSNPAFPQTQTGEIRVRGFDVDARANLTRNLEAVLGYAYLDSEITKSSNLAEIGAPVQLVPMHQASAWAKYTFSEGMLTGLSLGAGVRYKGELYAPELTPGRTLVDAMVSYDLGRIDPVFEGAQLSLNATNIFDKYYVEGYCDLIYCSLGEGRMLLGTLAYKW